MFNTPYDKEFFRDYSEDVDGDSSQRPTVNFLSDIAKETGTYLIGGSISELSNDNVYNTSLVFNPEGDLIARHRKVHLFDIDVPGQKYMVKIKKSLKFIIGIRNPNCWKSSNSIRYGWS